MLQKVTIKNGDFTKILKKATKNDLIYFDPPYTTSHKNDKFIEYNSKNFPLKDQKRLKRKITRLNKKGCKIIMSNANHKFIKNLYKDYCIHRVKRRSLITADNENRKKVTELIITNFK